MFILAQVAGQAPDSTQGIIAGVAAVCSAIFAGVSALMAWRSARNAKRANSILEEANKLQKESNRLLGVANRIDGDGEQVAYEQAEREATEKALKAKTEALDALSDAGSNAGNALQAMTGLDLLARQRGVEVPFMVTKDNKRMECQQLISAVQTEIQPKVDDLQAKIRDGSLSAAEILKLMPEINKLKKDASDILVWSRQARERLRF